MSAALPAKPFRLCFPAAGALGLLSVLVPHDPATDEAAVLVISLLSLALGVPFLRRPTLPAGWVSAALAAATGLASAAILATGGVPNASTALYTWIALYAAYLLRRSVAVAHVVLIAGLYAAVVALSPPDTPPVAHWTTSMGTLLGATLLVSALKGRLDGVIDDLSDAARTDPLTGLLNRRALHEVLDLELERARRTGRPLALLVLDVDRFKLINDVHGHAEGDRLLRDIGAVLRAEARRTDSPARLGGEELAVLLPETSAQQAVLVAERLRTGITQALSGAGHVVTCSFGIAAFPEHGETQDALLHCADQAMYAAKRAGRDRVVRFQPGTTEELLGRGGDPSARSRVDALVLLAESLDLRDTGTAAHSRTVGRYAGALADALGFGDDGVERVRLAGVLHDVGKLSMPHDVLHAARALTPEERTLVERHPELGARLLESAGLSDLSVWVECHHERPDGRGYPRGLRGDAIPLEARVLAVADAFEAMTADRPYRAGMSVAEARAELRRCAGTQFDEQVVAAFDDLLERGALSPGGRPAALRATG
ncbi:diguanylate cyclase [Conexibacter sp. SYSU D00693]|uniref:bifunctional diguanylate cyclase/phosphohydrolase n=1 Tax=Conexibacter sp. SYSU D00693 TaxID=2812560 RepID=UPI00196A80F6|nr:diguanylate cyclase [Conexibacter sp. SYSU D00693]